jgi:hypothetical protein
MNGSDVAQLPGGSILGTLLRHALARITRRRQAQRQLEQLRNDIDARARLFLASTRGGTIPQTQFPIPSANQLTTLHAEGFLTSVELEALQMYFAPAQQANSWLTAPEGENISRRLVCLLQGRRHVEWKDRDGNTLLYLARRAVAGAQSAIDRQRWKPW